MYHIVLNLDKQSLNIEFSLLCRVTLHIPHVGPNAKTVFSPLHAIVLPVFSLLASFTHNMSKPNSVTFQSEYLLKELFFLSVLNSTKQLAVCFPPCGKRFCLSSRVEYCDRLKEKYVVSTCMAQAVEQVK